MQTKELFKTSSITNIREPYITISQVVLHANYSDNIIPLYDCGLRAPNVEIILPKGITWGQVYRIKSGTYWGKTVAIINADFVDKRGYFNTVYKVYDYVLPGRYYYAIYYYKWDRGSRRWMQQNENFGKHNIWDSPDYWDYSNTITIKKSTGLSTREINALKKVKKLIIGE
jgi:hypothetical protein